MSENISAIIDEGGANPVKSQNNNSDKMEIREESGGNLVTRFASDHSSHSVNEIMTLLVEPACLTHEPHQWSGTCEKVQLVLETMGPFAEESSQKRLESEGKRRCFHQPSRQKKLSFDQDILMSPTSVSTAIRNDLQRKRYKISVVEKTFIKILRRLNASLCLQEQLLQPSVFKNELTDTLGREETVWTLSQTQKPSLNLRIVSGIKDSLQESILRERVSIITVLHQNVTAIKTLLTQRESQVTRMSQKINLMKEEWQSHDEVYRLDTYNRQQYFNKIDKLSFEIKKQRKLLKTAKPEIQSLAANIQRQKSFLRKAIFGVQQQRWRFDSSLSKPTLMALLSEVDNYNEGPMEALRGNWKAAIHTDPELFRLRRAAVINSIFDYDLKEFIERNPFYVDILARHTQTPALLEALQFDGVSFLFSGIGTESERVDIDSSPKVGITYNQLDSSFMAILAHWIEENPYFYKLCLDECIFSLEVWELISGRMSRISRITEISLTRCKITPLILKFLLKWLRRNPISKLDLGYNQLKSDGMKLLAKGLLQKVSQKIQTDEIQLTVGSPTEIPYESVPKVSEADHGFDNVSKSSETCHGLESSEELYHFSNPLHSACHNRIGFRMSGENKDENHIVEILENRVTGLNGLWVSNLDNSLTKSLSVREQTIDSSPYSQSFTHRGNEYDIHQLVVLPRNVTSIGLNLIELVLPVNDLGDKGAVFVAQILKSNAVPHLTSLDLRWNNIGVEGAAAIASALNYRIRGRAMNEPNEDLFKIRPPLENLNLTGNDIEASGASSLISALVLSPDVVVAKKLNLSMNHVNNDIFSSLESWVYAIATSGDPGRCIHVFDQTSINLEWNALTNSGAVQRLVRALSTSPFISEPIVTDTESADIHNYFDNSTTDSRQALQYKSPVVPINLANNDFLMDLQFASTILEVTNRRLTITAS